MEAKLYNQKGEKEGEIALPKEIFGLKWNSNLVHQVVVSMQSNARTPVAHTKNRGEVRGGGKKPWRQKGTGRARHGSIRSPIWKGGGVTFGPRNEKDYSKKINKKMKTKAFWVALSKKFADGEILFVDNIKLDKPNAKDAKSVLMAFSKIVGLEKIAIKKKNTALISLVKDDKNMKKSFGNFGNIELEEMKNLNAVDVLKNKYLIITDPEKSFEIIKGRQNAFKNAK